MGSNSRHSRKQLELRRRVESNEEEAEQSQVAMINRQRYSLELLRNFQQFRMNSQDYLVQLPDEMILQIFRFLPRQAIISCSYVCKRLAKLAYDPELWKIINLSKKTILNGGLSQVLARDPIVLHMVETNFEEPLFIAQMPDSVTCKTRYLDLGMSFFPPSSLANFLKHFCLLEYLSVESCEVNDEVCQAISQNTKLLQLNLCMTEGVTKEGMESILTKCVCLKEFNIAWAGLDSDSIRVICEKLTPNLAKLDFSGYGTNMKDEHVSSLVKRCQKLSELNLSDCFYLQNCIPDICKYLTRVTILSFNRCHSIDSVDYWKIFDMPSLQYLNILGIFTDNNPILQGTRTVLVNTKLLYFSTIARPNAGRTKLNRLPPLIGNL